MTDFDGLLRLLADRRVEFVLVGGLAASAHGSARYTQHVDVVYRHSPDNISRLAGALANVSPYFRGAPLGLPFRWDAEAIAHGLNFTLVTSLGDIDLLGEIAGGGRFEDLQSHCVAIKAFD
jgi:hypothetical protein